MKPKVWELRVAAKSVRGYQYPRIDLPIEVGHRSGVKPGVRVALTVGGKVVMIKPVGAETNTFDALEALLTLLGFKVDKSNEVITACNNNECIIITRVEKTKLWALAGS